MDLKNYGVLKGVVTSMKPDLESGKLWFLLSVRSKKTEKGYESLSFPVMAFGQLAKAMNDFVVVGQKITVAYKLGNTPFTYTRNNKEVSRTQLTITATAVDFDERKDDVLARQAAQKQYTIRHNAEDTEKGKTFTIEEEYGL